MRSRYPQQKLGIHESADTGERRRASHIRAGQTGSENATKRGSELSGQRAAQSSRESSDPRDVQANNRSQVGFVQSARQARELRLDGGHPAQKCDHLLPGAKEPV